MLVLTSNGISNADLHQTIHQYIKKQGFKKAALVVTADDVYKENNWNVPKLKHELESLGLEVVLFDFDTDSICALETVDVIEFNGGNPFYLLDRLNKARVKEFLHDFSKTNIIIGMSAGSFVMQKSINLVNMFSSDMNTVGLKDLSAMDLTDVEILPHFNKLHDRFPNVDDLCSEYGRKTNSEIIPLKDGEALLVDEEGVMHLFKNSQ